MNTAQHMNRLKDRNHTVISTDTGKGLDKDQHRFMMKVLKRLRLLGHTQHSKGYCDQPSQSRQMQRTESTCSKDHQRNKWAVVASMRIPAIGL